MQAMRSKALANVRVRRQPGARSKGCVFAGPLRFTVALGRAGIKADKREGDGATPRGRFRLLRLWWRADRLSRPSTLLPLRRIHREDAWCEDPTDRRYNRPVRRGEARSGDRLWRADHLYDLIIELDHNSRPRVAGP